MLACQKISSWIKKHPAWLLVCFSCFLLGFFLFGWRGCSLLVACAVTVCVVTLACAGVSVLGGKGVAFPCYSFYSFSAILNCAIAALYLSRFCLCFSVLVLFCSLILRHCCVVLVQILLVLFCVCAFLFFNLASLLRCIRPDSACAFLCLCFSVL